MCTPKIESKLKLHAGDIIRKWINVTNRIITKTSEHNHSLERSVGYVQMSLDKMVNE